MTHMGADASAIVCFYSGKGQAVGAVGKNVQLE